MAPNSNANENAFRRLLKEHLRKTRAGKFGQFEHAWSFVSAARGGSHDPFRIGPGENILFEGELTDGQPCSLRVTNELTGASGGGFHGQTENPGDRTIVVGESPATGQATLEFSCPTSGGSGGGIVSYVTGTFQTGQSRWEAIDDTDTVIFSAMSNITRDIYHDAVAGDWYCAGTIPFGPGFGGDIAKFNPAFEWRGWHDGARSEQIAYDSQNDRVGALGSTAGKMVLLIYDGSGGNQGMPGEPAALFEVQLSDILASQWDIISDNAGFFYVATRNNDAYQGATPGEFRSVFKIDSSTGVIVNSFDTQGDPREPFNRTGHIRLALGPDGKVLVCQPRNDAGIGNVFLLDSSLNLLASDNVDWTVEFPAAFPPGTFFDITQRFVYPTFDEEGRIFLVSGDGFVIRWDNLLTTRQFSKFLIEGLSRTSDEIKNIGHNLDGKLILFAGGPNVGRGLFRFDNDGVALPSLPVDANGNTPYHYTPPLPVGGMGNLVGHVSPGGGGGPGPDLGSVFTQELSTNPPGVVQAIAAVKYSDDQFITAVYFNSVMVEFNEAEWKATHSVQGVITPERQWKYNSIL